MLSAAIVLFVPDFHRVGVLNVSVSASHVIRSSDCGNFLVVYSSSDPINQSLPFSPIMYLNKVEEKVEE